MCRFSLFRQCVCKQLAEEFELVALVRHSRQQCNDREAQPPIVIVMWSVNTHLVDDRALSIPRLVLQDAAGSPHHRTISAAQSAAIAETIAGATMTATEKAEVASFLTQLS